MIKFYVMTALTSWTMLISVLTIAPKVTASQVAVNARFTVIPRLIVIKSGQWWNMSAHEWYSYIRGLPYATWSHNFVDYLWNKNLKTMVKIPFMIWWSIATTTSTPAISPNYSMNHRLTSSLLKAKRFATTSPTLMTGIDYVSDSRISVQYNRLAYNSVMCWTCQEKSQLAGISGCCRFLQMFHSWRFCHIWA